LVLCRLDWSPARWGRAGDESGLAASPGRRNFDPGPEFHTVMPKLLNTPIKLSCLVAAAIAACAALCTSLAAPPAASASTKQISMLDDATILSSPSSSLPLVRSVGAKTVRVFVYWYNVAPHAASKTPPKFNASNPSAYPSSHWAPYDALVKAAKQQGITVDFVLSGGTPRWAEGKNPPAQYRKDHSFSWMPNAKMYGQFVHAVTQRYSGHFKPAGSSAALPAVGMWTLWNEPNFGQDLGPQAINSKPIAPKNYRALLNSGWKAIHQTKPNHGHDTILIGELAAKGYALPAPGHSGRLPGTTAQTRALVFVRALYCLSDSYRKLTGSVAALYGCPKTAAARGKFRAQNPALFGASGFGIHAYDSTEIPNANPAKINADYATFPVLKRVAAALDRTTRAYGSGKHYPIYNDEYGYITSPPSPKGKGYPSPAKAAIYLNQAEFLSYKNPRIAAYDQFLLNDPTLNKNGGAFSSGLYTAKGKPKATLAAYRLPVWLPKATVHAGAKTEIWGGARPAAFASSAHAGSPTVQIQMQKGGHGSWTTITTVKVSSKTGYFDIHSKLPYSGNLRLAYTYPKSQPFLPTNVAGSTIHGRTVKVKVAG
jgi:hypothetical protein